MELDVIGVLRPNSIDLWQREPVGADRRQRRASTGSQIKGQKTKNK
jgi:hypothetical protein